MGAGCRGSSGCVLQDGGGAVIGGEDAVGEPGTGSRGHFVVWRLLAPVDGGAISRPAPWSVRAHPSATMILHEGCASTVFVSRRVRGVL